MKAIIPSEVATILRAKLINALPGLQILPMASLDGFLPEMNEAEIFLYHYQLKPVSFMGTLFTILLILQEFLL
jgi:hypothetical protein